MKEQGQQDLVPFGGPPPYGDCVPEAAGEAVAAACAAALAETERIGSSSSEPTWDNTVAPLDAVSERVDRQYSLVAHMHAVAASPEWDRVNEKSTAEVMEALSRMGQHAGVYRRLCRLRDLGAPAVPAHRERILGDLVKGFELSGVGLEGAQREKFVANEMRLSQLSVKFEEHVREATAAWSETVADEEALGSMPADMRAAAQTDGGWRFSLLDPSYLAYMTHGTDRGLRERMARARNARASDLDEAGRSNVGVVGEILALRWEQADALGYPDPATMILSRRMAGDVGAVAGFIERLAERALPTARKELGQLQEFARERCGIAELEPWDMAFVTERMRAETVGLSEAELRPYFGAEKVAAGLFACLELLFGISFKPAADRSLWCEDMQCLEVATADGEPVGFLYVDLYARPSKRGGAWAHGALARCRTAGGRQLPTALVNCNFTSGAGQREARLGWMEVVTLFHEFGHAIHHLLAKVDDYCASGMNGVEWDAVELPSQFLENFAWREEVALGMSEHLDTGAALPREMFARFGDMRRYMAGQFVARQLAFGAYDLEVHRRRDADPLKLWPQVRERYWPSPRLADDRFPCAFGHIFAGGYATGYYGYLWADVLAADSYAMFEEPGADDARLGKAFAAEVLERGGTRSAADNFRALRGRDPDPAALMRRLNLA